MDVWKKEHIHTSSRSSVHTFNRITMWLTLDIGNSAVKGGLFAGSDLHRVFHLDLTRPDLSQADSGGWSQVLRDELDGASVTRVGVTSVVPDVTPLVNEAASTVTGAAIDLIEPSMRLPFELAYETPATLGTDRLAAAAGAWVRYSPTSGGSQRSVIAIDAGTALTYEVVSREGVYCGGAIAPGPALLRRALHEGTAQLPEVPLVFPPAIIGRSTQEALQAGIMSALVDSVRGMLGRIAEALDETPITVITGGWRSVLHDQLDEIDHVDPHLVLHGIRALLAFNPR